MLLNAATVELSWIGEQMQASQEMMHTYFSHTQDKKWMLLGSITTRWILSRLLMQVQRHLHNEVKPLGEEIAEKAIPASGR